MRIVSPVRHSLVWCVFAAALAGTAAHAARVVDVRVGRHEDFTRVVFELDAAAPYRREDVRRPGAGREVVVRLEASATARAVGSTSPLVESVSLEPDGAAAVARIRLRTSDVRVVETRLSSPPRIVVDVRRAAAAAPGAGARTQRAAKPKPSVVAPPSEPAAQPPPAVAAAGTQPSFEQEKPRPGLTEEEIERALLAAGPEGRKPAAPKPQPSAAPAAGGTETPEPRTAEGAAPALPSAAAVGGATEEEAPAPPSEEAAAGPAAEPVAEGEEAAPGGTAEGAPASEPLAAEQAEAEPPPAEQAAADEPQSEPAPIAPVTPLEAPSGLLPLGIAVAGVALLLLVWRVLGRRKREAHALSPLAEARSRALEESAVAAAGPAPVAAAGASVLPPRAAEALAEALAEAEENDAIMTAVPEPEPGYLLDDALAEIETGVVEEVPPQRSAFEGARPSLEVDAAMQGTLRDLDRRLAQIEARIEQILDGRDRVDRQLAAQTEELRVQRAAIARTQRVLRTVVRPEDVATEPASRDPGRGPAS